MTISILGLHCLNAVTDDYETAASIVEHVRRPSHGLVPTAEVTAALDVWNPSAGVRRRGACRSQTP